MSKFKIKRITGDVLLIDAVLPIAIILAISIGALTCYNNIRARFVHPDLLNIVTFANHLTYSTSDQDTVILNYHEIIPFQRSLISKINCDLYSCETFNINDYNENTYVKVYYHNSHFISFSINSKNKDSIFEFNKEPFSNIKHNEFNSFLIEQQKVAKDPVNKKILNINYLSTLFTNISMVNILDRDGSVLDNDINCKSDVCTNTITYTNNNVSIK